MVWVEAVCGGSPVDGMGVLELDGSLRRNLTRKVQFAVLIGTYENHAAVEVPIALNCLFLGMLHFHVTQ
jgi:hypothetical protein